MARIDTLEHFLTDVATAIRNKTNSENILYPTDFDTLITNITTTVSQNKTVAPSTSSQLIEPDLGYNALGQVVVTAVNNTIDSNIQPENIKKDITILGVTGTLEGGIDTSDATAGPGDILLNKTAYVNGEKITGTLDLGVFTVPNGMKFRGSTVSSFNINTSNVTDMSYMFSDCESLTSISLDTSLATDMVSAFNDCQSLSSVSLSDTSNVTNMRSMFGGCSSLASIPQLDTSSVTDMSYMFSNCEFTTASLSSFDTSRVTTMNNMFSDCSYLTTVSDLDTSNVTDVSAMFMHCISLTTIPQLNLSHATTLNETFWLCNNLTGSVTLTLPVCTSMASTFHGCGLTSITLNTSNTLRGLNETFGYSTITSVSITNTSGVTTMGHMFSNCENLITAPNMNTSSVEDMGSMFDGCVSLETVPIYDMSSVMNFQYMFNGCDNLSNQSLDNIMASCITCSQQGSLSDLGLNSTQIQTCTTLSNYNDFIDAGWTE